MMRPLPASNFDFLLKQTRLILSSYKHWFGKPLCREDLPGEDLAREVFFAPFVLASAGGENDPILNYGNEKALQLWEMKWNTFTQTPGRHTAEVMQREERERFLEKVKKNGFVDDYRGIRISSTGRRFEIRRASVWNLLDSEGKYAGQAVTFNEIIPLSP